MSDDMTANLNTENAEDDEESTADEHDIADRS